MKDVGKLYTLRTAQCAHNFSGNDPTVIKLLLNIYATVYRQVLINDRVNWSNVENKLGKGSKRQLRIQTKNSLNKSEIFIHKQNASLIALHFCC